MQFLEKLWKILGSIKILNMSQQKEEDIIWYQTKLSYYKVFLRKFISNRNKITDII